MALRDADAELEVVAPAAASSSASCGDAAAHRDRHAHGALAARPGHGIGSLKNTISPSPVKRSSVPSKRWIRSPERRVVLAEHRHHVLGLDRLRERGEAAQVAEHDGDLAPVALQERVVARGDDQLGELRREEAAQPAEPLELVDLLAGRAARAARLNAVELGGLRLDRVVVAP